MSSTLIERSEAAQNELVKLRRSFQLGSWITGIVGTVIIVVLGGYFCYGYIVISELKDPEPIIALVGQMADTQIPLIRARLESQVDKNATAWAQDASDRAVAFVPTLRKKLEELASEQVDKAIDQINVLGEKEFRRVLDENRDTIKQALQDLEDDKEISDGVLLLLEEELAKELKMNVDALAGTPLVIVSVLNSSGKTLLAGENLTEEQEHERRVLMIVRRLQDVQFPNVKIKGITLSPEIAGGIEQMEQASLDKEKKAEKAATEKVAEPAKKEAPEAKDDTAAKPEAEKADPPKKAETDGPSDEEKVAEAKPAGK